MQNPKSVKEYKEIWNQADREERQVSPLAQFNLAEDGKDKINFNDAKYLIYDNIPICFVNGVLYAMYPIDDPSLGYKLLTSNFDKKVVLLNPRFISERQAVDFLFSSN